MTNRTDALRHIDLPALLDDLGQPRSLARRGRQFPCPNPAHEQTGTSPPVSISAAAEGYDLWKCHACDAGGTAIDALIVAGRAADAKAALEQLDTETRPVTPAKPRRAPSVEPLPSEAELARWSERLLADGAALDELRGVKGWAREAVEHAGLGADAGRFTVPVRDARGDLVNVLRYAPGHDANAPGAKMRALSGRPRTLYPAPESVEGEPVWIVEGEPDAITMRSLGLPAVAVPGANGWRREYAPRFTGRSVVVCCDCDGPGRKLALTIAADLLDVTSAVRVLDLAPSRDDGYDVGDDARDAKTDEERRQAAGLLQRAAQSVAPLAKREPTSGYIAKGGRVRHMVELAERMRGADEQTIIEALRTENALRCRPPLSDVELRSAAFRRGRWDDEVLERAPWTDAGNARVFAAAHGHHLKYVTARKRWHAYIDGLWRADETGHAERAAKQVAVERARVGMKVRKADDGALHKFGLRSQNGPQQAALLRQAQSEAGVALRVDKFDRDPWRLACANGVLDLRSGSFSDHRAADLTTRGSTVEYDPDASCPRWRQFLREVFADDDELIAFVQRAAGYSLTGDVSEEAMFILWGDGANGKTTLVNALRALMGDLALSVDFAETFAKSKRERGARNDLARLHGARMVIAAESAEGRAFDEEVIKRVTSREMISARFLFGEHFEYRPQFKLWLMTNHRPRVDSEDEAMWRRIRLIPFEQSFKGREDRTLDDALHGEAPGILRWAVEGCLAWQRDGLGQAGAVTRATEAYRDSEDVLTRIVHESAWGECFGSRGW